MLLSEAAIQHYRDEGYVFLRGVLPPSALELIRLGIERSMANPSPWVVARTGAGARYHEDRCNFSVNAELQRVIYESPIADYMAELIGADRLWLYYEQVICKIGAAKATDWHQDMSYYLMAPGEQSIGAWISLDPLDAAFALEVVAKSHKGPLYNMQDPKRSDRPGFNADLGSAPVPDIEADRAAHEIVSFKTEPGDMLVFHRQMLHGGAPMIAGQQRRALSVSVFGPEMRYQPKPDWHSPTFPGLEQILKPGEPLHRAADAGFFPQLRPLPEKRWGVSAQHDRWHGRIRKTPAVDAPVGVSDPVVSERQ
jgi:Phytanoyl-CoA dioxygenase (PhyH)